LLEAARKTCAEAIHPGYGFSAKRGIRGACLAHGIVFIGPTPEQMRDFGLKHVARRIASENGVPYCGQRIARRHLRAVEAAGRIGYPVMLKSTAAAVASVSGCVLLLPELHEAFDAVAR